MKSVFADTAESITLEARPPSMVSSLGGPVWGTWGHEDTGAGQISGELPNNSVSASSQPSLRGTPEQREGSQQGQRSLDSLLACFYFPYFSLFH